MARFYDAPDWRFVVTLLNGAVTTFLDRLASNRQINYVLNDSTEIHCDVPSDNPEVNIPTVSGPPFVTSNSRLLYAFRREAPGGTLPPWVCRAAGVLHQVNDEIQPSSDSPVTHLSAYDPLTYLKGRPVVADDGTLPGSAGLTLTGPGGTIIRDLLLNAVAGASPSAPFAAKNCFIDFGQTGYYGGVIETSMPSITVTFKQGMMVGDAIKLVTDTGNCDVMLKPIFDPVRRPGFLAELSVYELAGSVKPEAVFSWDMAGRSILGMNRLEDGAPLQMVNVGQGYLGQGGEPEPLTPGLQTNPASIAAFGDYWLQQFFSNLDPTTGGPIVDLIMAAKVALQAKGMRTITVDLASEFAPILFQEYFLGDQVPLWASRNFRDPINPVLDGDVWTNLHRIYAIPVTIPDDAPETVTGLLLSPPASAAG